MYMNFNDACFFLDVSCVTLQKLVKVNDWTVLVKGTEKYLDRATVEQYKAYIDSTYNRRQAQQALKEIGYNISLRTLYTKLRENRRYTLAEVCERLGLDG